MSDPLDDAYARLAEGVAALRAGPGWKAWLDIAAAMPNYSVNNQLLLMIQNPNARMVCGYKQWSSLGRNVTKGEKALRVLAPITRKADHVNKTTGEITSAVKVFGFRPVPVFDISQTEGPDLDDGPTPTLLEGEAPEGLWDYLAQQVVQANFTLHRTLDARSPCSANGITNFRTKQVDVRYDVSDAQAVKTLAHELAHVRLHDPATADPDVISRGAIEVEAESVAYLVTSHYGLESSGYTFAYVAGWSRDIDDEGLVAAATRIRTAAQAIITFNDAAPTPADLVPPGPEIGFVKPTPPPFNSSPPDLEPQPHSPQPALAM